MVKHSYEYDDGIYHHVVSHVDRLESVYLDRRFHYFARATTYYRPDGTRDFRITREARGNPGDLNNGDITVK